MTEKPIDEMREDLESIGIQLRQSPNGTYFFFSLKYASTPAATVEDAVRNAYYDLYGSDP